ncbi:MAG: CHASE2 domain-containing protein [Alphaproteobacteria bacterium]
MRRLLLFFRSRGRVLFALTLLVAFVLDVLGSFRLTERLDAVSYDILGNILAPTYGLGSSKKRFAQDKITVLLVNQQTLENVVGTDRWPPNYSAEADFAEWAARDHPAVIFLDFYYPFARRIERSEATATAFGGQPVSITNDEGKDVASIDELGRRLKRIAGLNNDPNENSKTPIPVFIGPVGNDPDLEGLRDLSQVGLEFSSLPRSEYPVWHQVMDAKGGAKEIPQAALALYHIICPPNQQGCVKDIEQVVSGWEPSPAHPTPSTKPASLAIEWGSGASANIAALSDKLAIENPEMSRPFVPPDCRTDKSAALLDIKRVLAGLAPAYFPSDHNQRCLYTDAFPIDWIRSPPAGFEPKDYLEGRAVLIGADLGYLADDRIETPTGSVPGVLAHAMALDNLLQKGALTARYTAPLPGMGQMTARDLGELLLVPLGALFIFLADKVLKSVFKQKRVPAFLWWPVQLLVAIAVPLGIAVLLYLLAIWPSANVLWIALLGSWSLFLLAGDFRGETDKSV